MYSIDIMADDKIVLIETCDLTQRDFINKNKYIRENEVGLYKAYFTELKKRGGNARVTYQRKQYNGNYYGRYYPSGITHPMTNWWGRVRSLCCQNTQVDIDAVKCSPSIAVYLGKKNNINTEILTEYISRPEDFTKWLCITEDHLKKYRDKIQDETAEAKDISKTIYTMVMYGAGEQCINDIIGFTVKPSRYEKFKNKVGQIAKDFCELPQYVKLISDYKIEKAKKGKPEPSHFGCFSMILQHEESIIISSAMKICKRGGLTIRSLIHDGFQVDKSEKIDDIIERLNRELPIRFIAKPWKEPIKEVMPELTVVRQSPEGSTEEKYEQMKTEFESTHFKIISSGVYYEIINHHLTRERQIIVRSKKQLVDAYEHMSFDVDANGKPKSFINQWVKDPNIKAYKTADVFPVASKCPEGTFNMWNPFRMEEYTEDYTPNTEGLNFLLNHIKVLCNHEEKIVEYFMDWLRHLIQRPDQKSTCPVFISSEGAGKGSFIELLKNILGASKVLVTAQPDKHVWGGFNNLMNDAYIVAFDELTKSVTMKANDIIKNLITDETININTKGVSSYTINSYHKYFMMTNKTNGGILTTKDDRRKFMVRTSDELIGNTEYFNEYYTKIKDIEILRTFYDYLKVGDVPEKLPHPPSTEYQETLKELAEEPIDLWLKEECINLHEAITENPIDYIHDEGEYSKDENGDIIWECKTNVLLKSFECWKARNGFQTYETNAVKMGVHLSLMKNTHIIKKKTKTGAKYLINVSQITF